MSNLLGNHRYRGAPKDFSVASGAYVQLCGPIGALNGIDIQNFHASDNLEVLLVRNPHTLTFDGTNDVVACDAGGIEIASHIKGYIKLGVRFDAGGAGNDTLFSVSDASTETALWIRRDANDKVTASLVIGGTVSWTLITDEAIELAEWQVLTLIQQADGNGPSIVINGSEPAQTFTVSTSLDHWLSSLTGVDVANIGALNYNSVADADFFLGDVDFLEVYDLTSRTLGLHYLIDEGSSNLLDSSGNGNGGTLAGASWIRRFSGMLVGNDSGRLFLLVDEGDIRDGVWLFNPGSNTITGRYKRLFAR